MVAMLTVNILIVQVTPVLLRSVKLTIFVLPVYISYLGGMWLANYALDVAHLDIGSIPNYTENLALLVGVGLPVGIACFLLGASALSICLFN